MILKGIIMEYMVEIDFDANVKTRNLGIFNFVHDYDQMRNKIEISAPLYVSNLIIYEKNRPFPNYLSSQPVVNYKNHAEIFLLFVSKSLIQWKFRFMLYSIVFKKKKKWYPRFIHLKVFLLHRTNKNK